MTLSVPIDEFPRTAERITGKRLAYLATHGRGSVVTTLDPATGTLVAAVSPEGIDAVRARLVSEKFEVFLGQWGNEGLPEACADPAPYVAAVAYIAGDHEPGLWVDAFSEMPSQMEAVRHMYDEFRSTGELDDVSFEEFLRQTKTNVVVLSPSQLARFAAAHDEARTEPCDDSAPSGATIPR